MTTAWHCVQNGPSYPAVAVNFYTGDHQDHWHDWGVRGTLIWPR